MADTYINPSAEQLQALIATEIDGPLVMVNLLRFAPDGGEAAYRAYGAAATPFIQKAGASIRFFGTGVATVIGGEEWDEVILVEYPNKQAFFDMTGDPDYPSDLRSGALADSRLYCTVQADGIG